jgi:hypothetical protein
VPWTIKCSTPPCFAGPGKAGRDIARPWAQTWDRVQVNQEPTGEDENAGIGDVVRGLDILDLAPNLPIPHTCTCQRAGLSSAAAGWDRGQNRVSRERPGYTTTSCSQPRTGGEREEHSRARGAMTRERWREGRRGRYGEARAKVDRKTSPWSGRSSAT